MKTLPRFSTRHLSLVTVLISAFHFFRLSAFGQGALTPPGPPAATMKSLDQIEARTPIDATNTPGDTNDEAVISTAGSYYLTGNLHVAKTNGIHVTVTGVTIDLNGFQIDCPSATPNMGIRIETGTQHCAIKNGAISGPFSIGIGGVGNNGLCSDVVISGCTNTGINSGGFWRIQRCSFHDNSRGTLINPGSILTECTADNNTGPGFVIGDSVTLIGCVANGNGDTGILSTGNGINLSNCTSSFNTGNGITLADGCALANCVANSNKFDGISLGKGCTLANCSANANQSAAAVSAGIRTGDNGSLNGCSASNNTTTNGTPTATTGAGFVLGSNCTLTHCTAANNAGDGVSVVGKCFIIENDSTSNGFAGFRVTGTGLSALNRIDGNLAVSNGATGILFTNDWVARNVSFANSPNYSSGTGANNIGPVQNASSATNPFANF